MKPIHMEEVQTTLEQFINKPVYVHVETTNGAYAGHFNDKVHSVGAYVRNANVIFSQAKIVEAEFGYRVGLKLELGWIYSEGLTDWTTETDSDLLLAGHDYEGRLMIALEISETPFR